MAKAKRKTTRKKAITKSLPNGGAAVVKSYTPSQFAQILMADGVGEKVTRPYEQSVWVNRCISQLASEISSLGLVVSENKDKILEFGELYDLVQNPNATMTCPEFLEETVSFLLLGGEVFWVIAETEGLRPKQIIVVGPTQMQEIAPRGKLLGWRYTDDEGQSHVLSLYDVIQIKFWNPYNKFRGLPPIKAACLAVSQDYKASIYNDAMLTNGAEPGGVLQTDQDLDDKQCEQIYANFEGRHQGPGKAKSIAILYGGLKYQAVASSMMDMQFQELKRMNPEEICIAFKTPPPVIGLVNDVKYSNLGEAMKLYFRSAIKPLAGKLGDIFTSKIARRFGTYWVWPNCDTHPAAIAEIMERMDTANKMCTLGATLNDVNRRLALGLPEYKWGNTWYKAMGLTDIQEPIDPGPSIPEGEEVIEETDTTKTEDEIQNEEMEKSIVQKSLDVLKTTVWERWASSLRPIEKRFADVLGRYFYRQKREILQKLEGMEKSLKAQGIVKTLDKDDVIKILFDVNDENGKLKAIVQPMIGKSAAFGASQAASEVGMEKIFGVADPLSIKAMQNRWPKLQKVNMHTTAMVKNVVEKGISEGKTVAQIASDIRKNPIFSGTRAMNIARTETAGAVSQGRLEGFQTLGVPKKAWLSARSGEVRKSHVIADATYTKNPIPVNEPFKVGNSRMMHPGDPAGAAEEVVNCRCCVLPVVENNSVRKTIERYAVVKFLSYSDFVQKSVQE
jgi:HK97 family phage portal protein